MYLRIFLLSLLFINSAWSVEQDDADSGLLFDATLQYSTALEKLDIPGKFGVRDESLSVLAIDLGLAVEPTETLSFRLSMKPFSRLLHNRAEEETIRKHFLLSESFDSRGLFVNSEISYLESSWGESVKFGDFGADNVFSSIYSMPVFEGERYKYNIRIGYDFKQNTAFREGKGSSGFVVSLGALVVDSTIDDITNFRTTSSSYVKGDIQAKVTIRNNGCFLLGYGYAENRPKVEYGSDYAYRSNQIKLLFHIRLARRLATSFSVAGVYQSYSKSDRSTLFLEGKHIFRNSVQLNAFAGVEYFAHRRLQLNAGVFMADAQANLPTGYIYNEQGIPIGIQDPSIGSWRYFSANIGMRFIVF